MAWGSGTFNSCEKLLERVEKNDPTLKELVILPMKSFGAKEIERLSNAIENGVNTHLVSISASGHKLPPESLKAFGTALSAQAKTQQQQQVDTKIGIKSLAIGSKDMGDEGVIALCQGLASSNGALLQHLDLGWKEMKKDGLYEIGKTFACSKHLSRLDLSRNDFGSDGVIHLNSALESIESLDNVVAFPALEQLILSECNIDSKGIDTLAEMLMGNHDTRRSKRIHLAIGSNAIGSAGCHALAKMLSSSCAGEGEGSIISHLQAAECTIGDDGIKILSSGCHQQVETMDISDNEITKIGADSLAQSLLKNAWPDLVELKLAKNTLGSGGIATILESLANAQNSSLKSLDLSYTKCGAEGAKAALMKGNLQNLRLFGNKIGTIGFDAIAPLLQGGHPNIINLDLGGNDAEEDSVVRLLDSIAEKKEDTFQSKLELLEIGGNKFGDKAMEALTRLKSVWPELDVAHDKPVGESGWQDSDQ